MCHIWIISLCFILSTLFSVILGQPQKYAMIFGQRGNQDSNILLTNSDIQNPLNSYDNIYVNYRVNSLDFKNVKEQNIYYLREQNSLWEPQCNTQDSFKKPHPDSCSKYFVCENGILRVERCSFIYNFDPISLNCKWSGQVNCYTALSTLPPPPSSHRPPPPPPPPPSSHRPPPPPPPLPSHPPTPPPPPPKPHTRKTAAPYTFTKSSSAPSQTTVTFTPTEEKLSSTTVAHTTVAASESPFTTTISTTDRVSSTYTYK